MNQLSLPSRRKKTQWHLFFQYSAIILGIVSGIILIPLYLKFIPLDLYGAWLATGNILAWITIIDPGLSSVMQQKIAVAFGSKKKDEVSQIV